MSSIRPLEKDDHPLVASLYACLTDGLRLRPDHDEPSASSKAPSPR